jgi:hypothetical protein
MDGSTLKATPVDPFLSVLFAVISGSGIVSIAWSLSASSFFSADEKLVAEIDFSGFVDEEKLKLFAAALLLNTVPLPKLKPLDTTSDSSDFFDDVNEKGVWAFTFSGDLNGKVNGFDDAFSVIDGYD